jgi:hypothetical protein
MEKHRELLNPEAEMETTRHLFHDNFREAYDEGILAEE